MLPPPNHSTPLRPSHTLCRPILCFPSQYVDVCTGLALSVGMVLLVAHRLALMRRHWVGLALTDHDTPRGDEQGQSTTPDDAQDHGVHKTLQPSFSSSASRTVDAGSVAVSTTPTAAKAAVRGIPVTLENNSCGARVVEAGVCLLALELAATLWVVGGWSSLVVLRFRSVFGGFKMVALAIKIS